MIDIGTLGGSNSMALSINSQGQVVGMSSTPGDVDRHPFLYEAGVMTDLTDQIPDWTITSLTGINDNGDIVGQGYDSTGKYRALLLIANDATDIPEPSGAALAILSGVALIRRRRRITAQPTAAYPRKAVMPSRRTAD